MSRPIGYWARLPGKSSLIRDGRIVAVVREHTRSEWQALLPSPFGWDVVYCCTTVGTQANPRNEIEGWVEATLEVKASNSA